MKKSKVIGLVALSGAALALVAAFAIPSASEDQSASEVSDDEVPASLASEGAEPPIDVPDTWIIDEDLTEIVNSSHDGHEHDPESGEPYPENFWIWHDTTAEEGQYVALTVYDSSIAALEGVTYDKAIETTAEQLAQQGMFVTEVSNIGIGEFPGAHVSGSDSDFLAQVDVWLGQVGGAYVEVNAYWPSEKPTVEQEKALIEAVASFDA